MAANWAALEIKTNRCDLKFPSLFTWAYNKVLFVTISQVSHL